ANLVYRRRFTVEWGHCDPAGIVFNSHFCECYDWSFWLLFETALGVPPNELWTAFGIVGIPLVDAKARFLKPAKFNDVADIASEVSEFRRSSFDVAHRISIGGELAVEGSETRVWAGRDPKDPVKLKGIPIPAAVVARFRAAASRLSCSKFPIPGLAERVPLGACPGVEDVPLMSESLSLGFDLRFEDLYGRDGLVRLDGCFVDFVKRRNADLHNRLMAARAAPEQLAGKAESDLIVEL